MEPVNPTTPASRVSIPKLMSLRVWTRDQWTCKYCGRAVFFGPTLRLLHELSPNHGYYQRNGKLNDMVDVFHWGWASIDHVLPVTHQGGNNIENLVSACWKCNLQLGNIMGDSKPAPSNVNQSARKSGWDGLVSLYLHLQTTPDSWTRAILANQKAQ